MIDYNYIFLYLNYVIRLLIYFEGVVPFLHLNVCFFGMLHTLSSPVRYCRDRFSVLLITYPQPIPSNVETTNAVIIFSLLKQLLDDNHIISPSISMLKNKSGTKFGRT